MFSRPEQSPTYTVGGSSVLYDAVAILVPEAAIDDLTKEATARDFVADAFQHCKIIGYASAAMLLLEKAGIADAPDEGVISLPGEEGLASFISELGKLRVWGREPSVKLGKTSPPLKQHLSRRGFEPRRSLPNPDRNADLCDR
jgi:catalase